MSTPSNDMDETYYKIDKLIYDCFYKGYEAGQDQILQYQFERDKAYEIRYINRCIKSFKNELAEALLAHQKAQVEAATIQGAIDEAWHIRDYVTLAHLDTSAGRRTDEYLEARINQLSGWLPTPPERKAQVDQARIDELQSVQRIQNHDDMSPDGSGVDEWVNNRLNQLTSPEREES